VLGDERVHAETDCAGARHRRSKPVKGGV